VAATLLPLLDKCGATLGCEETDGVEAARAVSAALVPAAAWRPRSLRTATAADAVRLFTGALGFAGSSPAHASALAAACLDVAASRTAEDEDEAKPVPPVDAEPIWVAAVGRPVSAAMDACTSASLLGPTARHMAATIARGVGHLPPDALAGGLVSALAGVLLTAPPGSPQRLGLPLLPALVCAAGGAGLLAQALAPAPLLLAATPAETPEPRQLASTGQGAGLAEHVRGLALSRLLRAAEGGGQGSGGSAADVALSLVLFCRALRALVEGGCVLESGGGDGPMEAAAANAAPQQQVSTAAALERCAPLASALVAHVAALAPVSGLTAEQGQPDAVHALLWVLLLAELCGCVAATGARVTSLPGAVRDVWQVSGS
jgi:hypothetical protein